VRFALERPLWFFAHPQYASPANAFAFAHSGCQTVASLERYVKYGLN